MENWIELRKRREAEERERGFLAFQEAMRQEARALEAYPA